jgi:hypothetical protein
MNFIIEQGVEKILTDYIKYSSRSISKSNNLNNLFKKYIETYIKDKKLDDYEIFTEHKIKCENYSGNKKCDLVIYYNKKPYLYLPLKFIMSSYKKNRNNYFESLIGEISLIKWSNPTLKIVPITIFLNETPSLNSQKIIKNFENINIKDFENYNQLIKNNLADQYINFFIKVKHKNKINEKYEVIPEIQEIVSNKNFYEYLENNIK